MSLEHITLIPRIDLESLPISEELHAELVEAINNSEISFGANGDTLITNERIVELLRDAIEEADGASPTWTEEVDKLEQEFAAYMDWNEEETVWIGLGN